MSCALFFLVIFTSLCYYVMNNLNHLGVVRECVPMCVGSMDGRNGWDEERLRGRPPMISSNTIQHNLTIQNN